jgi:Transposase
MLADKALVAQPSELKALEEELNRIIAWFVKGQASGTADSAAFSIAIAHAQHAIEKQHEALRHGQTGSMPPQEPTVATMCIDIGKYSFHVVGLDQRGAIVLRQKWSRRQIEARLANIPRCLIGMEACVGAHHLSRKLQSHGHDARLMPAKYVRPYSKGQKNDFRDAEAIAEAGRAASISD